MRQAKYLVSLCALVLATIGYAWAASAGQPLAAADSAFGFGLFKQLTKNHPAVNISISPYSIATLLHMMASGASGNTATEIQQMLGTGGLSTADVNAVNNDIAQSLTRTSAQLILTTVNAVWYRPGTPVGPGFTSTNRQFYGATIEAPDFNDPHAVDIINMWASNKTGGKIRSIADGIIDPRNTQLILANAIYFKGKWLSPFEARYTRNRPFHLDAGRDEMIAMMQQSKHWEYREGGGYQAVRLPYEGDNLAMYVVLPGAHTTPETILGILSSDNWRRMTHSGFSSQNVNLVLPKFRVEYGVDLRQALQALGMNAAFSASSANFSGIAPGVFISAVRHRTLVETNEEGTQAAAATVGAKTLGIPEVVNMIVDRPFLFLMEDRRTETILFIGLVFDPAADNTVERLH